MTAESLSIPPSLPKACNCLNRDKLIESLNNKVTDLINHDKNCETPIVEIDVSPKNSVTDFTLKNLNIDPNLKFEGYKESEINRLKEEVTNSEEKVVTTSTSIQLPNFIELIENLTPQVELRQELIENVKPYYENLEKFVNYFSGQKIVKEHLNNATDDGHWMLIKNQLQEIFSDYTSTLCKLEALKKNMDLLKTQSKDSEQKSRQEEQALRSFTFEEELSQITLEKCSLEEQRKSLDKFREILLTNQENLNTQVEILKLEKLNLSQEKTALDRQSKLYEEQEKALIIEKKNSLKVSAELNEKIINLEEHLKKQNELSYVDKENVMVLRAQLDIYRTDFEQEKSAKKNLIREKNKLIEQIQAVTVQNQELRNDIDKLRQQIQQLQGPNNSSKSQSTSKNSETVDSSSTAAIQIYSCPLCCQKFSSYEPLEQHADECIRLSEGN